MYLPFSQWIPLNPSGHWHLYESISSTHVAPFWHVWFAQSSISINHNKSWQFSWRCILNDLGLKIYWRCNLLNDNPNIVINLCKHNRLTYVLLLLNDYNIYNATILHYYCAQEAQGKNRKNLQKHVYLKKTWTQHTTR